MSINDTRLIALAESCGHTRVSVGRLLMAREGTEDHQAAAERFENHLRELLRLAREERPGMFLEVASELAGDARR